MSNTSNTAAQIEENSRNECQTATGGQLVCTELLVLAVK